MMDQTNVYNVHQTLNYVRMAPVNVKMDTFSTLRRVNVKNALTTAQLATQHLNA